MAGTGAAVGTSEPLPQSVTALALALDLGALRATCLPKRVGAGRMVAFVVTILIGLLCFILPGVYFIWMLSRTPNFSRKLAARRLYLFENGLIVSEQTGPTGSVRWDRVTMYQEITRHRAYGIHTGTTYQYNLTGPDRAAVEVTQFFAEPEVWGQAIQSEITRAQLPAALRALESGQLVYFADIAVNAAGVTTPKQGSATWSEIGKVSVTNGVVYLRKGDEWKAWYSRPVSSIPNFPVFIAVVDRLRAGRAVV